MPSLPARRLAVTTLFLLGACGSPQVTDPTSAPRALGADRVGPAGAPGLNRVNHVVVIYLENHSFDNLYGSFSGADGLANAGSAAIQRDGAGNPYTVLPMAPGSPFPTTLVNGPFDIGQYIPSNQLIPDLVHRFYQEQAQIHGGAMDRFVAISDVKGQSMGYYQTAGLPLAAEAAKYTVLDRFFHGAFGGSFLNHMWLIAARTPSYNGGSANIGGGGTQLAPTSIDASGKVVDGQVALIGGRAYLVNTVFSVNKPALNFPYGRPRVPNLVFPTIGDRLTNSGISWKWFAGGWDNAMAGSADPLFQFHHQPFVYFEKYSDGTQAKADHLRDEKEFLAAAQSGTLPAVSFVKPLGGQNEHPGYTDIISGENHVIDLINAVRNGPNWRDAAIIITYDENGGFWDHVAPPATDIWGPGARVPTIIISPFARKGAIDHTDYDTTSILAFIEHRWHLTPLTSRDAAANDLTAAFDFSQGGK